MNDSGTFSEGVRAIPAREGMAKSASPDVTAGESAPVRKSSRFSWTILNFWVDFALLMNFLFLLWVSALLQFVFPAGAGAEGASLWGSDVTDWRNLQFGTLCAFAGGVLLHLMLHWTWVCGVINKQICKRTMIKTDGTDTLIGVILIVAILHLLGISVLAASWFLVKPGP